jgi:glycosyltransferase involved in cell wall biosynthesis
LKVGVYLTGRIAKDVGGGFFYSEKLIEAIDNHRFDPSLQICFVGRGPLKGHPFTKPYHKIASSVLYKIFRVFEKLGITPFFQGAFNINIDLCNRLDKRILRRNGVHVVLYPVQTFNEVKDFPFISMNWDIGHLSAYAMPEFVSHPTFHIREKWYKDEILKAQAVFVESHSGKEELVRYTGINTDRVFVVPIFPGRVVELSVADTEQHNILRKFDVGRQQYFFYPAQFWAHKNHYNLLTAFAQLRVSHPSIKLVLSGSDKGNRHYIESLVRSMSLNNAVIIAGFISNEEVFALYKNAAALVMPTFLGPTNMPLLEAQRIGTPVICSDFAGHREQCGNGALYIDPAHVESICAAMQNVLSPDMRSELLAKGERVNKESTFTIEKAIAALEAALRKITPYRLTFRH